MRIITQNILKCNVNECRKNDFPLKLVVDKSEIISFPFNSELIKKSIKNMNWNLLRETLSELEIGNIPEKFTEDLNENEPFLMKLNSYLFEYHIIEGKMYCSSCKRLYPIKNRIPNMLLEEKEL